MRLFVVGLAIALFSVFLAGCYTEIVHPRTDLTGDVDYSRRQCSDCHGSADYYYWHYPYSYTWYWGYDRWRSYYCDPWWWHDYWYWYGDESGGAPTGAPQYYGDRERPAPTTPSLVPGSPDRSQGNNNAAPPNTPQVKPDNSSQKKEPGKGYWERPQRPPKPQKAPADSEKKKAEEGNDQ